MDHSQVTPQTCVLKMNVKCGNCQRRVKKTLQKIHGVHSINIDANEGKVTLSTSVDPHVLIEMLTEAGKAAQLLWVQKPQVNNQNHDEHPNIKNVPIDSPGTAQQNGIDCHKLHIGQLQEFSKIKRLRNIEINHHRNIKLNFKDHDDDVIQNDDHKMKINVDDVHGTQVQNGAANGQNAPPTNGGSPHQCGHSSGGGGCSVHAKTNVPHCCNHIEFICVGPSGAMRPAPNYVPIAQANYGHPFAPPPPHYVPRGLPPANYPYADMHCDDALNTCSIM